MTRVRAMLGVLLLLTACAAPTDATDGKTIVAKSADCTRDKLVLHNQDKLTIGLERPPIEPWYIGADPANGKGYESALAYEIARMLGFERGDVVWVDQVFNDVVADTPKRWDFDINEFTITEERAKKIDFSKPYYDNDQALVLSDRALAKNVRPTLEDALRLRLGAQADTTSYKTATVLRGDNKISVYDTHDAVLAAMRAGQIDAMLTDAPTAMLMMMTVPETSVLARIVYNTKDPAEARKREQFGIVFPKGSKLRPCVDWAIDEMWTNNKIRDLQEQWLKDLGAVPEITLPKR